jgi:hypothetical protein
MQIDLETRFGLKSLLENGRKRPFVECRLKCFSYPIGRRFRITGSPALGMSEHQILVGTD